MSSIRRLPWLSIFLYAVLLTLVVYPLMWLVAGALTDVPPLEMASRFHLTFATLARSFFNDTFPVLFGRTLLVSALGTALAVMIGGLLAWIAVRTDTPAPGLIEVVATVPVFLSPVVVAVAWVSLASPNSGLLNAGLRTLGLPAVLNVQSMAGIIFLYALYYAPYAYLYISSALRLVDSSYEEAAQVLGASTRYTQWKVTFPLVTPAILSSVLLIFAQLLESFAIPQVLGSPARLFFLAPHVYSLASRTPADLNQSATLSIFLILVTATLVWLQSRFIANRSFFTAGGKGLKITPVKLGRWRWVATSFAWLYLSTAVILPTISLVVVAFRKHLFYQTLGDLFSASDFTLNHVRLIMGFPVAARSLVNSMLLGIASATVGVILCAVLAYVITRTRTPGRRGLDVLAALPVAVPGITIGLAYLWAWTALPVGLYGTVWLMILAYVTRTIPQGVRGVTSSLSQIGLELEEAGRVAGAGTLTIFRQILLPLIRPGLLSAAVLIFILAMRELSISIFLYTPRSVVLSVAINDLWTSGSYGGMAVLALVQTLLMLLVVFLARRFFGARST